MLFNLIRSAFSLGSFSFDGDFDFAQNGYGFEIALNESGTLTLAVPVLVDIFLLNAGEKGETGDWSATGGQGGDGGKWTRHNGVLLAAGNHTVTIGASNGAASSLDSFSVPNDASHTAGGLGSQCSYAGNRNAENGEPGIKPWPNNEDSLNYPGRLFGPSGGGGSSFGPKSSGTGNESKPGGAGGSGGDYGGVDYPAGGDGASDSGSWFYKSGSPADANSGGGGGGGAGAQVNEQDVSGQGGAGGSGVVLIRRHKEVAA